jgi:hypothetical protein
MAEEFVEIEQENDPLGILSKKPATPKVQGAAPVDNDPLGILKKKSTPVVSSVTPSPLPSQPDFLKQGASLADNSFLKGISKSIPKGPAQPAAPEGKWSNIVQNVFANLELAGTNLVADATTLVKDLSKNPYIPDVSSAMKQVEESTGKSIPTPWQLDPLGGVIRGLHGNQERMKQVIANNPLPNTFWGKAVSSVNSFVPDIAVAGLFPETKLSQGASFLAKTGNLLFNNFTKYMAVKEGLSGYGESRKKGKDIGESSLEAVKGAGRGTKTGMEMALLGAGSNMATKSIMNQAEKIGLTGVKGMATKELVNLANDVLAFGIVSPFANAALEGRWATGEEIANGTGIAALFRVKGGLENIKSNVELNRALRQTQEVKQGVAISNFVDATPESIIEVYNSPESADMLHLKALVATKKAKETTDLQKKAQYTAEAITFAKASGVKQATDMVIQNKDGFADLKASNDLPESAKKEFLQKAEEINNLLNPLKKQEVDLDNKIKESEDLSSQFSQQAQQSQDPNQRAELEAKAREAKDNADNLRGQLTEVKFNQNRPDANAGKGIPSELIVDVSSIPKETTEPVKLPITEEIPEITVEGTRNGYEVIAGNEANSIGDIRQEAAERRNNGEKFFVKETEKDGKKIFTLVDTTVFDEFGTPGFKSASVTVPENARLSSEALMSKMKDALGVTDKTSLQELDKITSKMMETEVEATPTEVKVTEEVKDLSKSSEVELEKRLLEIEGSKSGTPERDEFNNIDKELEKREWRKVFDSPLDKVSEVADELIKKDKEQQNGFGSYIEQWDARSLKLIANKYSKENVKKLTDSEIIKDYKDAMFGNPTSWYSDGLRLRESVKEAQNRGIDVFKELSKEFVKDGYSEQDAMVMAKRKLEPILKDLKQSSEKPLALEQKPTEVEVTEEVKTTEVKTVEQLRAEEQAELDSKIPNAEQYRVDGKVDRAKLTNEEDIKAFDEVYNKYDELISPLLEKPTEVKVTEEVKPTEAKAKEEKTFAQKDLDRAEAKKIHSRVAEMEPPSDAAQVALRYLSEGGKVSQDAINEISGTTKRASLNTGRRELKTAEAKARDYASGNESLDDLAHRLWENSGQEISERDIKDALMVEIGSNNTRLDASKAYLERYSPEYQEEQYYNRLAEERKEEFLKEQEELERQLREPLDEQIEGEASVEHINNLIKQYEAEFERENKQLESESKGEANKEISGRDGGKEGLKEEYEKIKSNKKKKDFVRNNLPEEFKPLADELTEAQMSEIVDSNFDLKTIKNIQDAVQKQSAAEVLQRKQEGDGGTGGGRKRVEQGKQGDESTRESKAKTAEEAQPKGAEEGEVIGITHEQLNEVARELDFPEYEASPETVEQWDNQAKQKLANDPEYANKLIAKYEEGKIPTPQEQRAMLVIISSAKAKINANPSPENLAQFKRIMELSNNVGGKLVGQSLRARQGVKQVEDTLPDFLLMRENDRGYPFTESEIKDQARIFEELQKEKNALKEALQKSEEVNAKLIAEMGVNKARAAAKKAAKKTREEYVIERKQSLADAREALRKLRTGEEGVTAVVVPYFRELKAVSPHVKKYIKSLVEEGANKLDDIVNDTYAEFKDIVDGMTKKDVLDIFNGEYDESKPRTRNEKAEELRLLQREAALIKELENVRKGIEKEKNPAQKVKKNDRILELEDKIKEVKRLNKERDRVPEEFTEPEFASKTEDELLASKRKMLTRRIEKLQEDIKNKRYLEEKKAPPKLELDRKTQLLKDNVIKLERQIEAERQKDAYKKMSKTEKALDHINQITGIRRVMQTAFDLSVSLRQGISIALNFRKWDVFAKAFGNQMKSVFSDKKFNSLMYDIHNSSEYSKMVEDGIKFNELDALKNEERNEDFQKSFLYGIKIPIVRQLITEPLLASQRAADGFLNTARYEMYLKYEKQLLKQGITRQSDPEAYKRMADLVMNMTGRGKLISFLESGKANKVVSNTFYGARLMAANINSLNPVKYAKLPPGVRKDVMKDVLSIVTTTTGIMLAASAAGATVTLDPDEPDFLQIRFGEKVYDITGGKAAYLRTFFRMVSALYSRVSDNKYNQQKKLERAGSSLVKFFRNKLAPNTGYAVNAILGKNTLNQDFDPYEVLEAYPMYADDFAEALKDEGITSLATVLLPNILGIGYGSYATQANKESLETSLERMLNSDEMNPELIKNHKDGDRPINNEEFDELVKLRDANIEKEIRKLYDGKSKFNLTLDKGNVVTKKVEDMTEEEVKKAKKSIASEATRLSKEKLFGKERKTREEKIEDRKLSRARKRFNR